LARTFGEHPWLRSAPARDALRRVLCAAARASPSTGYAQSMNYVAGFALLVYRADEEAAFWLVRAALERLAAPRTYSRDLEGLHVELRTLAALLADKAPRISAALAHLGAETSLFATEWLLCLFTCTLPAEARLMRPYGRRCSVADCCARVRSLCVAQTAARVWDAFLCEGAKVLVRVSIALLKVRGQPARRAGSSACSLTRCPRARSWMSRGCCAARTTSARSWRRSRRWLAARTTAKR
jgi:hypothetical protein